MNVHPNYGVFPTYSTMNEPGRLHIHGAPKSRVS